MSGLTEATGQAVSQLDIATTEQPQPDDAQQPSSETTLVAPSPAVSVSGQEVTVDTILSGEEEDKEEVVDDDEEDGSSNYWDPKTMAPLNAASAAAIARLRAFRPPPFPLWDRLPLSRRAAVLLLLYADRKGDLRVVITMRAASLRSFSGHAALPGGKADSLNETPYQIARREAWEEIGLPMDDSKIPAPFRIEHLCYLPMNLARTELVVRPCVALLHAADPPVPTGDPVATPGSGTLSTSSTPTVEESLIPRLDAREVAAVFSAPFHNFLRSEDEVELHGRNNSVPPGKWYEGSWTHWHEEPWRMHFFYVPVNNQRVTKPRVRDGGLASLAEEGEVEEGKQEAEEETQRYKVWGMTARILVDAATVAYGEAPEFEHNSHFGDERIIEALEKLGRLGPKKKAGSELTPEDVRKAIDLNNANNKSGSNGSGSGNKKGDLSKM